MIGMKKYGFLGLTMLLLACGGEQKGHDHATDMPVSESTVVTAKPTSPAISAILSSYYSVKDALVEADSTSADLAAKQLLESIKSIDLNILAPDSSTNASVRSLSDDLSAHTSQFLSASTLTQKRRAFSLISVQMLPFLMQVDYKESSVYQQVCPMAFNDTEEASWLSSSPEIMNPYLGKKHPKYAAGMLHCGELTDSIAVKP
jgi:Cu(I)/Ag(I) efflux system membrane fusion protein